MILGLGLDFCSVGKSSKKVKERTASFYLGKQMNNKKVTFQIKKTQHNQGQMDVKLH